MIAHHAQAVTQVLAEIVEQRDTTLIPAFFLENRIVSEFPPRVQARLFLGHSFINVFPYELLEVKRQLVVKLFVELLLSKNRSEAKPCGADNSRKTHSAKTLTRA